jgi:hypothetical protein
MPDINELQDKISSLETEINNLLSIDTETFEVSIERSD